MTSDENSAQWIAKLILDSKNLKSLELSTTGGGIPPYDKLLRLVMGFISMDRKSSNPPLKLEHLRLGHGALPLSYHSMQGNSPKPSIKDLTDVATLRTLYLDNAAFRSGLPMDLDDFYTCTKLNTLKVDVLTSDICDLINYLLSRKELHLLCNLQIWDHISEEQNIVEDLASRIQPVKHSWKKLWYGLRHKKFPSSWRITDELMDSWNNLEELFVPVDMINDVSKSFAEGIFFMGSVFDD
jgi:hypothetical protein